MPRCITSTSPDDRSASRYLARRPSPLTVLPLSRFTKSFGSGQRRSPRCATDLVEARALHHGRRPRRTVSTSGSSGMVSTSRWDAADIASPVPARYGPAETGLFPAAVRTIAMPGPAKRDPFRLPQRAAWRQAGAGRRRVPLGGAALRPDERPDVGRAASRLERRAGHGGQPAEKKAAFHAARSGRRHRRRRLPRGRGRRAGHARHRRRHQRRDARRSAASAPRAGLDDARRPSSRPMPKSCRSPTRASTPSPSPSASATCRASTWRSRRLIAC